MRACKAAGTSGSASPKIFRGRPAESEPRPALLHPLREELREGGKVGRVAMLSGLRTPRRHLRRAMRAEENNVLSKPLYRKATRHLERLNIAYARMLPLQLQKAAWSAPRAENTPKKHQSRSRAHMP